MAFPSNPLVLLIATLLILPSTIESTLTKDYYNKTCPNFHQIIQNVVTSKQIASPTTAAATLRLFFHDCMIGGCDASILVSTNAFNHAERDADINLSLPGDGFDVVVRAKTAVELECPGIVSCSDILAVVARDLVTMTGGPFYNVPLGRMDGTVSNASAPEGHIARPNMTMDHIISLFAEKNFSVQEMVALNGAHTIGFSHCKEFSNRIFKFSKTSDYDPALNPKYAEGLRKLCANYTKDEAMSAFNDVMTPNKFDNMYFKNLKRGLGLLASDQAMADDKRTKPFVDLYAANQTAFFDDFGRVMEKVSMYQVKTGKQGEVRHRCDAVNSMDAA